MKPVPPTFKQAVSPLARDMIQVGAWILAMITLVAFVAYPRVQAFGVDVPFSAAAMVLPQAAGWLLFGMAIAFVVESMRPFVAMGVTRRTFAMAAITVLVGAAAVFALYTTVFFLIEGWWYERAGWTQGILNSGFVQEPGAAFQLGLEVFLRGAVLAVSGLLVGWSYQALNAWLASFLLLLTAAVPFGILSVFLDAPETVQRIGLDLSDWSQLARSLTLLLFVGGLYLVARTLLSRMQLKARVP